MNDSFRTDESHCLRSLYRPFETEFVRIGAGWGLRNELRSVPMLCQLELEAMLNPSQILYQSLVTAENLENGVFDFNSSL